MNPRRVRASPLSSIGARHYWLLAAAVVFLFSYIVGTITTSLNTTTSRDAMTNK
jgi:hypothetical protein